MATLGLGGALAYINVSETGANVFTWFSNLTSLFTLFGWGSICFSHIRMRRAWSIQGRSPSELPWTSWTYPYAAYWGLSWCIILIIVEFYLAVSPLDGSPSAENFFANYVSVILILIMYLGARIYYRGPWIRDLSKVNLDDGRRFYVDQIDEEVAAKKSKNTLAKAGKGVASFLGGN